MSAQCRRPRTQCDPGFFPFGDLRTHGRLRSKIDDLAEGGVTKAAGMRHIRDLL